MDKKKYPMKMLPYFKKTVWGGDDLSERFGKKCPRKTGEAWEVSTRGGCESIIANGELAGMTLGEYFGADEFPLLIKFIDAAESLSVQVHPDEKSELWYIIDASPDAKIIYGVRESISVGDIAAAGDDIEALLRCIKVKAGDVFYIPAGQIHALGAGILVAEIQQNCDTTYRLYDYGRGRETHVDKALDALRIRTDEEIAALRYMLGHEGLANCEYFNVTEHCGTSELDLNDSFSVVMAISGSGELVCDGDSYGINAGDTYLLPCGCENVRLVGNSHILEVKTGKY